MSAEPTAIFVYGTLQRGQCRERCWPKQPLRIELATVQGALYDLGRYPTLAEGDDCIAGELWHLAPEVLEPTLAELDRVEAFRGQPDDLYLRVSISCQTQAGPVTAWAYRYARWGDLNPAQRIAPDPTTGRCRWPVNR